jgi:hypothetical protein
MRRIPLFAYMAMSLLVLSACSSTPAPGAAESEAAAPAAAPADPVSGTWSGDWGPTAEHRNNVTLELSWDGTNLNGTVNPGPSAIQVGKASFDSGTGAVMMEAEAKGNDGNMVHYMIEGKLEGNTMMGTWAHEKQKGDFKIAKN